LSSTLVDTGPPNQWPAVRTFLQERKIERVLVTHHHEDHSGNARRLKDEMRANVFVPERGIEPMSRGFRIRPYQWVIWGKPGLLEAKASPDEMVLEGGLRLRTVAAPGHSPDMTCYLEPERGWLFTGDLYIASKPRFMRADEDVEAQIASLRRVLDLDFETVFCAHRGVITDGRRAIQAKLDYLASLRDEVRHLDAEGRSIGEITRILLGRENFLSLVTFYHFSKRNLVRGCLA
jgi:glyoxylase-like metal-dependent hydrolase (beta-lactamase superfamily II)